MADGVGKWAARGKGRAGENVSFIAFAGSEEMARSKQSVPSRSKFFRRLKASASEALPVAALRAPSSNGFLVREARPLVSLDREGIERREQDACDVDFYADILESHE